MAPTQYHPFARFGGLTDIMNIGLLLLDSAASLEFASPPACLMLDCADEEEMKSRWDEIKLRLELDKDLPRTAAARTLNVNLRSKEDKTRVLRLEVFALKGESCTGYLVLINDRQIADVLETELLLASQMRAQAHLSGALVHDLRAPLNAMQITLELLADALVGGQDADLSGQQRYISVLREELARLDRALGGMLDNRLPSSSAASGEFELRALVEEVTALVSRQATRRRVALQHRLPDREVRVIGQRDRLKQALINVAVNALEAMPNGGQLRIDMKVRDASVDITVCDDGPGIPADLLDKKTGSGMGLYVARLVLESHGGAIQAVDGPGAGACFTLTVPLAAPGTSQ